MTKQEQADQGREPHGWVWWTTIVLIVVLTVYPLSFGPACWYVGRVPNRGTAFDRMLRSAYAPVIRLYMSGPEWAQHLISWYGNLWGSDPNFFLDVEF